MKKFIKILYLVIVPVLLIWFDISIYLADKVEVFIENYTLLSVIGLFHIAFAIGMYHAYHMDVKLGWKNKLFKVDFERAPGIGLFIGIDNGFLLVIPFVCIKVSLIRKKKKNVRKSVSDLQPKNI